MIQVAQVALCSQIHTEHINTLCGQNVQLLNVKLVKVVDKIKTHILSPVTFFFRKSCRL